MMTMRSELPYLAINDMVPPGVEGRFVVVVNGKEVTVELLEQLEASYRYYRRHRRKFKKLVADHYSKS